MSDLTPGFVYWSSRGVTIAVLEYKYFFMAVPPMADWRENAGRSI